jgi:hypothetical protein
MGKRMHHGITAEYRNRDSLLPVETIAKTDKKGGKKSRLLKFSTE